MQRTRTQTCADRFKSVSLDTFFSKKFFPVLAANVLKPVDRREKNTRQGVAPQDTRDVQLATQTCVHKQTTNKKLVTPCVHPKVSHPRTWCTGI